MKEKLEQLEKEYQEFLQRNKQIFEEKKRFKKEIQDLHEGIALQIKLARPPFPYPDLEPDALEQFNDDDFDGIITQEMIDELDDDYKDQVEGLVGWKVEFYDEASGAVNDGDYYDVSITLTDPSGNVYTVEDQTCLAVGFNFGSIRFQ